jgi:peptide chain release factor subunit 1
VLGEISREKEAAKRLKEAILKGEPVAYGAEEVRSALKEGRVNRLILLNDFSIPGMVCKSCRIMLETKHESCPSCGGNTSIENVAEDLYQMAQRTGAEVLLVKDDEFLKSIGGVGAILRY